MSLLPYLIIAGVLAPVVILAHIAETRTNLRQLLYMALFALNWLFVGAFLTIPARTTRNGDMGLVAVMAIAFGVINTLLLLTPVRLRLARLFPPRDEVAQTGFDPASMVHMTGLIFTMYLLGNTILGFAVAGGLSGLTENFAPETTASLILQMLLFVTFAALGVGFGVRRDLRGTLARLGLRFPTVTELAAAGGVTFLMFSAVTVIGAIWEAVTPPEVIREQTSLSELIAGSVNTLSMGFWLAATAAIGEEIAFRGTLQPVFGLWPTTILFALVHIQYTLTPATLIIVIVGFGLGWLRRRYNTTPAIVTHFLYNFVSIALVIYGRYVQDIWGAGR
ncbi:MAG: CPBP family intramembrane metalloprotease [Anaerolineae bacterium]|nr:CPBP family intramembrane metalloprotease [Anaerolineae bacterium]